MPSLCCEECGTRLYRAGERAPAGVYLRVDDASFQRVQLIARGVLPASLDGHVALYRAGAAPCACQLRHEAATHAESTSHTLSSARVESVAGSEPPIVAPARREVVKRGRAAPRPPAKVRANASRVVSNGTQRKGAHQG